MKGCSSSEVGSVKTHVKIVTTRWLLFESVLSFAKTALFFHKTLKSISVRKSCNCCTNASIDHDLPLNHQLRTIVSAILSDFVNNLGFYKMS